METPYFRLYGKQPEYNHLRVFGTSCFPWQAPLTPHKFAPRAPHCLFLGYSTAHKGYKCFHLNTGKLIHSRHVAFNEQSFPFSQQTTPSSTHQITPQPPNPLTVTPFPSPTIQQSSHTKPLITQPTNSTDQSLTIESSSSSTISPPLRSPPQNSHHMTTRLKSGISKPKTIFNLHHSLSTPTTYLQAAQHPQWREAMSREFQALQQQGTWCLVPRPINQHVLGSKWTYRTKTASNGSAPQYKARLVAKGFDQQPGIDFHETFSPVAKLTTIRAFFTVATYHHWILQQLDVSNAFLHGALDEIIYMEQPKGFEDNIHPTHVCLLRKAIYGLKQAPRQWNIMFTSHLKDLGFAGSTADTSLLIKSTTTGPIYILLYVDDFIITGSPTLEIQELIHNFTVNSSLKFSEHRRNSWALTSFKLPRDYS